MPPGPLVTTVASLKGYNPATVTATVAHFSKGVDASYSSTIPAGTGLAPDRPDDGGEDVMRENSTSIILGTVFGTLLVALVILSVLLWRAKRKKTRRNTVGKETPYDRLATPSEPSALQLGELEASSNPPATPGTDTRFELNAPEKTHEMEVPPEPVELPAEVPSIRLHHPERGHSLVSAITTDSRRSSMEMRPVSLSTVHMS